MKSEQLDRFIGGLDGKSSLTRERFISSWWPFYMKNPQTTESSTNVIENRKICGSASSDLVGQAGRHCSPRTRVKGIWKIDKLVGTLACDWLLPWSEILWEFHEFLIKRMHLKKSLQLSLTYHQDGWPNFWFDGCLHSCESVAGGLKEALQTDWSVYSRVTHCSDTASEEKSWSRATAPSGAKPGSCSWVCPLSHAPESCRLYPGHM